MVDQTVDRSSSEVKHVSVQPTLTAFFVQAPGRREELLFLPKCAGCGKIIFDVTRANVAVTDRGASLGSPKQDGDVTFREVGPANTYCWACDSFLDGPRVPWLNAAYVFRGLGERQPHLEPRESTWGARL